MVKRPRWLVLLLLGLMISSCVVEQVDVSSKAKTSLAGMTKAQVLGCMGAPPQHATAGETEVWSYPSGGDIITLGIASSSYAIRRYCLVNIVMSSEHVISVNYTGRTGKLDAECAFAVKNCVP